MKKLLTLIALVLVFFILDNSFIPFFSFRGYYPSILFLFIISFSIINGPKDGVIIGICSGILQDLYFFNGFGVNTLVNMLICALAGLIGTVIFKEKYIIPIIASFLLCILKGLLVFVILYAVGQYTSLNNVLFDSIYSLLVMPIVYIKVYKLCSKNYMQREWEF